MNEHNFLNYQRIDVHFVYGFMWDDPASLDPEIFSGPFKKSGHWKSALIHERVIGSLRDGTETQSWIGAYQPSFELLRRCLETSGTFSDLNQQEDHAWLIVPEATSTELPKPTSGKLKNGKLADTNVVAYPIQAQWTMRLFDTGSGVVTIRICLENLEKISNEGDRFALIHRLLRLVPNMDNFPEDHAELLNKLPDNGPVADSFIYVPGIGTCRLFEMMRTLRSRALLTFPKEFFASVGSAALPKIQVIESGLVPNHSSPNEITPVSRNAYNTKSKNSNWCENQTPYVFVTGKVAEESLTKISQGLPLTTKELVSIYARATLDNRRATLDFTRITEDYLRRAIDISESPTEGKFRIRNWSHDEALFYAFSKRGAIAVTASPDCPPATFVIPSLLNLFELLRARQFAAVVIGARLTEFARKVSSMDPAGETEIDLKGYMKLRRGVVMNLQNLVEHLFDGGATTELALAADRALAVSESWERVRLSFDVVDRLMTAWETARYRARYR